MHAGRGMSSLIGLAAADRKSALRLGRTGRRVRVVEQEKGRTLFEAGPQRDGRTDFYVTPNLLLPLACPAVSRKARKAKIELRLAFRRDRDFDTPIGLQAGDRMLVANAAATVEGGEFFGFAAPFRANTTGG